MNLLKHISPNNFKTPILLFLPHPKMMNRMRKKEEINKMMKITRLMIMKILIRDVRKYQGPVIKMEFILNKGNN